MQAVIKYIPKIFDFFNKKKKGAYIYVIAGGRGKGATWGIASELIERSFEERPPSQPHLILCTREIKESVDYSSMRTIERLITLYELRDYFSFYATKIVNRVTGATFIFTGLSKLTEDNVQGIEGISISWLGEAHTMEMSTWQKFEPTIREEGAIIYIDYNIRYSNTPVHSLFTKNPSMTGYPFEGNSKVKGLRYLFLSYLDNTLAPQKTLDTAESNKAQYSKADWEWVWLGKLKDASERFICDESLVIAAQDRELETPLYGYTYVGADIAHLGGDEIIFYKRKGDKVIDKMFLSKEKTPETTRKLDEFCEYNHDTVINIDNGHVGAAVADNLEELGYDSVHRIDFGGSDKYFDPDHSANVVTDMAFNLVDRLTCADIPKDDILKNQIAQRRWDFKNEKGVRIIESKKEFRKHAQFLEGHKSPDRFDALMLCFYETQEEDSFVPLGNVM